MNKQEIYAFLQKKGIPFEVTEHAAVFNMAELSQIELPYPEADAKNLFVRDDKKQHYYLITVQGSKRVDLKEFRNRNGLRRLSFASPEELMEYLSLTPGSVTPLGLLNDSAHRVHFYLDAALQPSKIGIHPNDNTATIWMQTQDLLRLILENGNETSVVAL